MKQDNRDVLKFCPGSDLIIHNCIDKHSDTVLGENLLWRNIEGLGAHVNFLVNIHTGKDEEHPGTAGASGQEQSQTKYYRPLVFLRRYSWVSCYRYLLLN